MQFRRWRQTCDRRRSLSTVLGNPAGESNVDRKENRPGEASPSAGLAGRADSRPSTFDAGRRCPSRPVCSSARTSDAGARPRTRRLAAALPLRRDSCLSDTRPAVSRRASRFSVKISRPPGANNVARLRNAAHSPRRRRCGTTHPSPRSRHMGLRAPVGLRRCRVARSARSGKRERSRSTATPVRSDPVMSATPSSRQSAT